MTPVQPPTDGTRLAARLTADGWRVLTTPGEGTVPRQTYGPPRGDGTRPTIQVDAPCSSYRVVATHPDGRGLVAVWAHLHGDVSAKTGKPSWRLDHAWRAPGPDEHGPKPLTAAQLRTYTAPAEQETAA